MSTYAETLGRVMGGDFAEASAEEKRHAAREVIQVCSIAAGAIALQPIPLLDIALIAPVQVAMVQAVGRVHGYKLDKKSVLEILSTFGASIVSQSVVMTAAKFVPFIGWAAAMSMSYALTYAVGEVSDHYFKTGRGVSEGALREMFDQVYRRKKAEKDASAKGDAALKAKLERLAAAYEAGVLTEEEYARKKEELLRQM
jgi:uncharacterized protein (DUF697 family)